MHANNFTAIVITASDSAARGSRQDASGPRVAELLASKGFRVLRSAVVADDADLIAHAIRAAAAEARLVVTTGGTGLGPRDVTPEATRLVCDRVVEGVAERMRIEGAKNTPLAILSRGICGSLGDSLVLSLPGSPAGASESLTAVIDVLPHALDLLRGKTEH